MNSKTSKAWQSIETSKAWRWHLGIDGDLGQVDIYGKRRLKNASWWQLAAICYAGHFLKTILAVELADKVSCSLNIPCAPLMIS